MSVERTRDQTKCWCFTLHVDSVDTANGRRPKFIGEEMDYMVFQLERCPDTGKIHWQGYVRFHRKKRMRGAKSFIDNKAHMTAADGTEESNRNYCTKERSRVEGTQPEEHGIYNAQGNVQGKRSDLEAIAAMIKEGQSLTAVAEEHPGDYIRYHSGIAALAERIAPKPPVMRDVKVLVLWGPTGTGKTHRVMTEMGESLYQANAGRDPFGQYNGEDILFLDEFRWKDWTIQQLNRLLDKWRCPLDCRYRNKQAAWTKVVICSNDNPSSWFIDEPNQELVDSLRRRLGNGCFLVNRRGVPLEELQNTPIFTTEPTPTTDTQLQTQ